MVLPQFRAITPAQYNPLRLRHRRGKKGGAREDGVMEGTKTWREPKRLT